MPSIDERVVAMAFENQVFEQRVSKTIITLGKLDTAIKNIGNASGLENIEKAANKVTLQAPMSALDKLKARFSGAGAGAAQGMSDIEKAGSKVTLSEPIRALNKVESATGQVGRGAADGFGEIEKAGNHLDLSGATRALEGLASRFSVLQGAATVAFGNIQAQAALKGAAFGKSFAFGPIMQGFQEYQTNLGSIQTILSNTADSGGNLKTVNAALQELNTYSDKTIYNFSEMAKNIGTFTAAGVQLKPATAAIKGIANLAALSGSNSEQASHAMMQLSQAIASGRVGLQDWNSVVYAGMGGAVFQKSLMRTAENMGTIEKGAVKIDKATGKATINGESFRNSIMAKPGQESWLTSDVLTNTLSQLTGDMTDAELAAKGFNAEQIKAIQKQAKSAQDAATQVKTLPQVFDVARETIGSGWAKTFQTIFGDFKQSKSTFTDLSNFVNGIINKSSKARNTMLAEWQKLGGREVMIKGIKQAFTDLKDVLKPIHDAFRDIFPASTGKDLFKMTKGFADLMKRLQPSKEVMDGLRRTFRGFFAVLHIGWTIVKDVIKVISDLLGTVGKGSGGFLNFTGSIGDFLTAVDKALTKGGALTGFFNGLEAVLKVPLSLLTDLGGALGHLFGGVDASAGTKAAGALGKIKGAADPLSHALDTLKQAWDGFVHVLKQAKNLVSPWLDKIGNLMSTLVDKIGQAFQGDNFDKLTSVIQTGFIGALFLAIKKSLGKGTASFVGVLKPLNGALGALTGNLKALQQNIKAQTIALIAVAIGILAASVYALSKVDAKSMTSAMTAIAVGLGELMGAMKLMTGGLGKTAIIQMPLIAGSMILLASSLLVLAAAVKIFSTMSWDELAKGLVGVGGGLAAIAVGMKFLGPGTIVQAPALLVLAVALNAIALAVKQFAGLKWDQLARGLAGVLGSLVAMITPLTAAGPELTLAAPGVVAVAFAMNLLAAAIKSFGEMNLKQLVTGLIGATLALAGIGIAMNAVPPTAALIGAGLLVVAVGMSALAVAVKAFGSMDVATLAKGIIAMGGALLVLGVGLDAMITALPGAAALLVAAAAFAILTPTLVILGNLSWATIFKGLGAIALALGTLAIAGAVAAPGLAALGVALLPLGLAFGVVAAAAYLFASAVNKVANDGAKGLGVLIAAIGVFIAALPKMIIGFLKGIVDVIGELAVLAPKVVTALTKILNSLIQVIINSTPKLAQAIGVLVQQFLVVVVRDSPKLIQAGFTLLMNFLKGIDQHISEIVSRVASIVTKFINALANKAPDLTKAGANLLSKFLLGIANHVKDVISSAAKIAVKFLEGIANALPDLVKAGAKLIAKFLDGIANNLWRIRKSAVNLAKKFLDNLVQALLGLAHAGAEAVIKFVDGVANAVHDEAPKLRKAFKHLAFEAADAFTFGLLGKLKGINLADALPGQNTAFGDKKFIQKLKDASKQGQAASRAPAHKVAPSVGTHKIAVIPPGATQAPAADAGQNVMDGMSAGIQKGLPNTKKVMVGAAQAVVTTITPAIDAVTQKQAKPAYVRFAWLGQNLVRGMRAGLLGMAGAMQEGVTGPIRALLATNKDLRAFGQFLGTEFRQGLTGGLWDDGKSEARKQIEGAFAALKGKLGEEQQKLRDTIKGDQDKLKQLLGEKNKNWNAINALRGNIANEKGLLAAARASSRELLAGMKGEESALIKLASKYEQVSAKLDAAKQKLADLKSTRDQAIQGYIDQFSALPDIGGLLDDAMANAAMTWSERWDAQRKKQDDDRKRSQIDQVANYQKALKDQIAATQKYMATLNALRSAGLDDATYKKLLDMGTAGQEFASQLLSKGPGAIADINALDSQLTSASTELAKNAAANLYQAGIDMAKGIVKGLQQDQKDIKDTMIGIAKSMVVALKMALGIKSPSRVFAGLGQFTAQGLVEGLKASSNLVRGAASGLGDDAADALTNSLSNISERVQNGIDTDVKITPVLDLSQVQKDASQIQDLSNVIPITAAASYGQAAAISQSTQADAAQTGGDTIIDVKLEQNNTSPKALDDVEIYRQTRNQLSQVKSALGLTTRPNP